MKKKDVEKASGLLRLHDELQRILDENERVVDVTWRVNLPRSGAFYSRDECDYEARYRRRLEGAQESANALMRAFLEKVQERARAELEKLGVEMRKEPNTDDDPVQYGFRTGETGHGI